MRPFDHAKDRRGTYAEKWDLRQAVFGNADVLPMWVADTDFDAPQALQDALIRRIRQAPLGYTYVPPAFFAAIRHWYQRRHGVTLADENIVANATVISGMNLLIQALTAPQAGVMMFDPVYFPFFNTVEQLDRRPLMFPLTKSEAGMRIDYAQLERFIQVEQPKLLLFCNPHNPGGRVWTADELKRLAALMARYQIPIISDEIHGDIIFPGGHFTPLIQAAPAQRAHIYTLAAPTKTFNIAGLKCSYLISFDAATTAAFKTLQQKGNYPKLNVLAITALITAYEECGGYVDALNGYLAENYQLLQRTLASAYQVMAAEGTFLVFIKVPAGFSDDAFFHAAIDAGVGVQMGDQFGANGRGYFRLNIGTQRDNIRAAVSRLNRIVDAATQ